MRRADPTALLGPLPSLAVGEVAHDWRVWRRPKQATPPGNWSMWLILAGRGFGKTRTGSEWVREQVNLGNAAHIALVGPTAADVRDTMIEGESGILSVFPPGERPHYEPSKRRVTFHNGATATAYTADGGSGPSRAAGSARRMISSATDRSGMREYRVHQRPLFTASYNVSKRW